MTEIKALYVQFGGRVNNNKHIVAAGIYSDKELLNIKAIDVCEMTNYELNKQDKFDVYRNRLAELYAAMNLIYKHQDNILSCGYDVMVLCPANAKLYKWLSGEQKVPTQISPLYESILSHFRIGSDHQLDICVGLSAAPTDCKVYKFCREDYIGARLTKYKRGIHIMTAAEIKEQEEKEQAYMLEQLRKQHETLEQESVSVYDILQPTQGDSFEPVIEFETPQN